MEEFVRIVTSFYKTAFRSLTFGAQRLPSPGRRERSGNKLSLMVAAQVHGDVREWQECQVVEMATITQSLSASHPRKLAR